MYDLIIHYGGGAKTMRQPVTVSLPKKLVSEAGKFCREHSITISEITREALREYLYQKQLEDARKMFTLKVEGLGISSEAELIRRLER